MNEPWNLRKDNDRKEDSLPTFIIFCEDEVSEPIYFKYFETSLIKVNPIKGQKSKITNVINAICHCLDKGIIQSKDGLSCVSEEGTQIWCVFDRDLEANILQIKKENISFDESIETANAKGFKVAWSNDAFELWILLHFEDVHHTNQRNNKREEYYDRLTDIFKSLTYPNENLMKALKHSTFSYKKDLKSKNNFKDIVLYEIIGKTTNAIKRAKILEAHFKTLNIPNHEKSPCTMVHHLVEELLRLGGKRIE